MIKMFAKIKYLGIAKDCALSFSDGFIGPQAFLLRSKNLMQAEFYICSFTVLFQLGTSATYNKFSSQMLGHCNPKQ